MTLVKMRVHYTLITFALICCLTSLSAQVTLQLDDYEVTEGEVFTVDVNVSDFDSIVGMQFSMVWDKSALTPIGVENYGLPDLNNSSFGIFEDAVTVQWIDLSLQGINVEDESSLFAVKFRAIAPSDSAIITFGNDPTSIEFIYNNDELSTVATDTSIVRIIGDISSAIDEQESLPLILHTNEPNPFTDYTVIQIEADYPQQAQLLLFDQTGKKISVLKQRLTNGMNHIRLDANLFPAAGTYYYQLLTDYYATTRKMVVLR